MRKKTKIISAVTNDVNQDQRLQRICGSLKRFGYDVSIVGRQEDHSRPLDRFSFPAIRLKCEVRSGILFYLEYNYKLYKYLMNTDFDIVNANDLDTIIACSMAASKKSKKLVFDAHEYFRLVPELQYRPIKRWIWHTLAKIFLKNSEYNYTVNSSIKEQLEKDYNIPFDIVHNYPLMNHRIEKNSMRTPARILYQGVLNKGRGLSILVQSMAQIEHAELYIVGRGVLEPKLKSLIKKYDLDDRVKLFGFVSPATLPKLTNICDIGINILDPNSKSYYYSTANKFYDYMAAGIPTINMNFPEYEKLQKRYNVSVMLEEFSVDAIVTAIQSLLQNTSLYNTLCENAIEAHKDLNWETEEQNLDKFYKKVMHAKS